MYKLIILSRKGDGLILNVMRTCSIGNYKSKGFENIKEIPISKGDVTEPVWTGRDADRVGSCWAASSRYST